MPDDFRYHPKQFRGSRQKFGVAARPRGAARAALPGGSDKHVVRRAIAWIVALFVVVLTLYALYKR